jgi:hypothetical protein
MQQEDSRHIDVSEGRPLVIGFEELFARPAQDDEGDVVFSRDEFEKFAVRTWDVQFKHTD